MRMPVYLDHAATTPVLPQVVEAMLPFFTECFGNPSAIHTMGQEARAAVEASRLQIASCLNASPEEIIFTSGGTESDNAALLGLAHANAGKGRHLLASAIEHHAVLEPLETLAREGWELEIIPVNSEGLVDIGDIAGRLRPETALVSVMHANNEIGTIQPIAQIGALCRAAGVPFHTDAVQSFGREPIDVKAMNIDLLSLTAHKFYGPKGAGALYVRRGIRLQRFMEGGEQERGRRAGTLNVAGIVGMGKAAEITCSRMAAEKERLQKLRDCFFTEALREIPGVVITGHRTKRMAHNVHLCIEGVEGSALLLHLDAEGICASAGSACSAGSVEISHVLKAIGMERNLAHGALRFTMGHSTGWEEVEYTLEKLKKAVNAVRSLDSSRSVLAR